jgi:5'-phosphate synthase pdxT subunit
VKVGVLALQGGFEPHDRMLRALGVEQVLVRSPQQLHEVTHLVLPGGESTTLHHLLQLFGMWELLRERHAAGELVLFGTCAGAILLGRGADARPPRLELLDAELERNAFGRQVDSFREPVDFEGRALQAVFIRAPRIAHVGPNARVLARRGGEPVLVEGPGVLAATFHPELGEDARIHERFLSLPRSVVTRASPRVN